MDMRQVIFEMLSMLDQAHLIPYINRLPEESQKKMIKQIAKLDLSVLDAEDAEEVRGKFEPLYAMTLAEIEANKERYRKTGLDAIRMGKVGAVLLAGGQGSRLGFDRPKGMFNVGLTKDLCIFECLMRNLLSVVREADAWIPLFVMTSVDNSRDTQAFFAEHNYFGYSPDNIWFFVQEQLPTLDFNNKLMLSGPDTVCTAPNGNGGWFASMERTGMLKVLKDIRVEWLNVFAVDNVLQRMADPCFIGAVIESGKSSGAKVVAKAAPDEKVGVLCLEDGRPSIVEYYEMTDEMRERREPDGTLSYNYGVILNYLFHVRSLNKTLKVKLPLHRAKKKIKHMSLSGEMICPEEPNAYKFETLALDMVKLQADCLAYEVDRTREFAPIKNKSGVDSVDTARELMKLNGIEL